MILTRFFAFLCYSQLEPYVPQNDFLKLFMLGDGLAVGFRFGIPLFGRWVWRLKDHIDRSFIDIFKVSNLPGPGDGIDTTQFDDGLGMSDVSQLMPAEALQELKRTDDGVDFEKNWAILRRMMSDELFREKVLQTKIQ